MDYTKEDFDRLRLDHVGKLANNPIIIGKLVPDPLRSDFDVDTYLTLNSDTVRDLQERHQINFDEVLDVGQGIVVSFTAGMCNGEGIVSSILEIHRVAQASDTSTGFEIKFLWNRLNQMSVNLDLIEETEASS